MKRYNFEKLMAHKPYKYGDFINQLGQTVEIYENPILGDCAPVIGIIENVAFDTDFFDTGDFFEGSDYNYCLLPDNEIKCFWELN